jgi:hypothetical protein
MKPSLLICAHRPVPPCRVAESASVTPSCACFALKRTSKRFAVRDSAPPGWFARRCSPPTATGETEPSGLVLIVSPRIRANGLRNDERRDYKTSIAYSRQNLDLREIVQANAELKAAGKRTRCQPRGQRYNGTQVWPKPPPHAVNVLLALFPLRSTLTPAAFRPDLRLGSGFGKFKAGALSFQREYDGAAISQMAVAAKTMTQLLESWPSAVCPGIRVLPRSMIIGNSSLLPLAFRVVLLASSEARLNFSGRGLHSVVLGLPLGALAAAPGCMKMLRIFFSRVFIAVFAGYPPFFRGRANHCAKNARSNRRDTI